MDTTGTTSGTPRQRRVAVIEEGKDYILEDAVTLPFRHIRTLGWTSNSFVEEVEDINTNNIYARKIIRLVPPRSKEQRRKLFENELSIIRKVTQHHHIIRVFASYVTKTEVGVIMQPVADQGDLEAFLHSYWDDDDEEGGKNYPPNAQKSAILERAFGCLANGLAFMHHERIRHKDIKPQNILIHQGTIIYTDFGCSLDSSSVGHSTTEGPPAFRTRWYSAPEVLEHEPRNSGSDIFSLGCVYLNILSTLTRSFSINTEKPFAEDLKNLHDHITGGHLAFPYNILASIVVSMTSRTRDRRPSASEVWDQIRGFPGYSCNQCQSEAETIREYSTTKCAHDMVSTDVYHSSDQASMLPLASNSADPGTQHEHTAPPVPDFDDGSQAERTSETSNKSTVIRSAWIWSEQDRDYYYVTLGDKEPTYHWAKASSLPHLTPRAQSMMPRPVDPQARASLPNFISGTPDRGWHEKLDPSYRMRNEGEARAFFDVGRVFAMLYYRKTNLVLEQEHVDDSTSSSAIVSDSGNDVYLQIRRFVVVAVQYGYVHACSISNYRDQGTLAPGCDPREYTIVYLSGTRPCFLEGEFERGMTKDPIEIMPTEPGLTLPPSCRLRFGKTYPVEWNVKVKDIGKVAPEHLTKLVEYWRQHPLF